MSVPVPSSASTWPCAIRGSSSPSQHAGHNRNNNPNPKLEDDNLQLQQPISSQTPLHRHSPLLEQLGSASSVVPLPSSSSSILMEQQVDQERQDVHPPVRLSNALRRRISDSSTSSSSSTSLSDLFDDDDYDDDDTEEEGNKKVSDVYRRYSSSSSSSSSNKRRKRMRVRFPQQLVQTVHPYPESYYPAVAAAAAAAGEEGGNGDDNGSSLARRSSPSPPPTTTSLWYTHSELLAMKRVAKRACAKNRELEHALNDAYTNTTTHTNTNTTTDPRRQVTVAASNAATAASAVELTDDSEQDVATATTSNYASRPKDYAVLSHSSTFDETLDDNGDNLTNIEHALLSIPSFRELRGMERWSSQRHALSRGLTMLQVKTEVFVLQAQHYSSSQSTATWPRTPVLTTNRQEDEHNNAVPKRELELELELARACSEASRPAARFARLMGRLDEAVAHELQQQQGDAISRSYPAAES